MNYDTVNQFPIIEGWCHQLFSENRSLTLKQLARKTGDLLRALGHPVKIKTHKDPMLDSGVIVLSAEYRPDLDEAGKERYMSIDIIVSTDDEGSIRLDTYYLRNFPLELVEVLVHEYRHREQFRARDFLDDADFSSNEIDAHQKQQQEYLGMPGEIDAFAANIAVRLFLNFNKGARLLLKTPSNLPYEFSPDLYGYISAFGTDHAVVKRLLRKIVKHLDALSEQSKSV